LCRYNKKNLNFFHVGHCIANVSNPMLHLTCCYYLMFAYTNYFFFSLFHITNSPFPLISNIALESLFSKFFYSNLVGTPILFFTFVSQFSFNQIWINLLMDDWHFGYIKKLTLELVGSLPIPLVVQFGP